MIQKIEKAVSYKEKVYKQLKQAIISMKIKPGELLNERKLADELGISRTPVREALQMLANDGWVIIEPWKGAYVYEITNKDIIEVFQVRLALEILAIELIVEKIRDEDLITLSNILARQEQIKEDSQAAEFIQVDREFHMEMARLTDNKILIDMLLNLSDMITRLGVQAVQDPKRYRETLDEHMDILRALQRRDKEKAIEAMKCHILKTKENIYHRFQQSLKKQK